MRASAFLFSRKKKSIFREHGSLTVFNGLHKRQRCLLGLNSAIPAICDHAEWTQPFGLSSPGRFPGWRTACFLPKTKGVAVGRSFSDNATIPAWITYRV